MLFSKFSRLIIIRYSVDNRQQDLRVVVNFKFFNWAIFFWRQIHLELGRSFEHASYHGVSQHYVNLMSKSKFFWGSLTISIYGRILNSIVKNENLACLSCNNLTRFFKEKKFFFVSNIFWLLLSDYLKIKKNISFLEMLVSKWFSKSILERYLQIKKKVLSKTMSLRKFF